MHTHGSSHARTHTQDPRKPGSVGRNPYGKGKTFSRIPKNARGVGRKNRFPVGGARRKMLYIARYLYLRNKIFFYFPVT